MKRLYKWSKTGEPVVIWVRDTLLKYEGPYHDENGDINEVQLS